MAITSTTYNVLGFITIDSSVPAATIGSNLILMEKADIGHANRSTDFSDTDPRLRIYSSNETQANDYGEFYHDQTNFVFGLGSGAYTFPDGNVGIGIDTPDGTLHVHTGSAGDVTASVSADDLVVEINVTGGISILAPDAVKGRFAFGGPTDSIGAEITWDRDFGGGVLAIGTSKSSGAIDFNTDAAIRAIRIDQNKNLIIGGGSTVGTSAVGVIVIANGTVPSSSPAGMIQIFSDDSSGGSTNATLAIRTEEAVASEVLTADTSLNIWINGIEYHWLLRAV